VPNPNSKQSDEFGESAAAEKSAKRINEADPVKMGSR
jgi:hypothetical protein